MRPTTSSNILTALAVVNGVLAAVPHVDFDRMGKVALVGAFAGIDLFQNDSVAFDPATSTLFSRDERGSLQRLASTNPGGRILAGCQLADDFYFAGLFSSVNGIDASNIAIYSPKSNQFSTPGSGGTNGEVEALYCDGEENKVWVGGSFSSPAAAVAVYNPRSNEWEQPPFGGLTGAQAKVSSITTNSSDSSIFFAGSFVASFGSPRQLNGTNNPSVPFSTGATPFSSSLVPVPIQDAEIVASPSSGEDGFSDIRNILCPVAEDDGPGNTWFAQDGTTAVITLRAFEFIAANGIRLGNTFISNRGTTEFRVTTIPDNGPQELRYLDPATGENRTCTDPCPLSTDSSVLYQDFLFSNPLAITGVEITLSGFRGQSAGLHMLQLLSSGAFASSIDDNNRISCYAPNPSNTTRTGDWAVKQVNTDIAATQQNVLISSVEVGTPAASGPTFTWVPYVSASGNYDINLLIPGCTILQDCDRRTSVQVVVFPGAGLPPNVMTVSQQNTEDASILIYSGPILPSSPDFVTTITMSLAEDPVGTGADGRYEIIADRVQLVLRSATPSESGNGNGTTTVGGQRAFGFLEWPRSIDITADGTNALPNSSITALDSIGFDLFAALGGQLTANPLSINAVAHHPSGAIFLGGSFTLTSGSAEGASNIVAFRDGALVSLPDRGLDGAVTSLVIEGDLLFVGGSFRDTQSGSTSGRLRGVAVYNIESDSWDSLGAGVNGQVTSVGLTDGRVQILGNFTELADPDSDVTIPAGGFAAWDVRSSSWGNPGGFTLGRMTLIANATSSTQYVAGNVGSARKYGASGMVFLQNSENDGLPQVSPLSIGLGAGERQTSSTPSGSSADARRHLHARARTRTWVSHLKLPRVFARQSSPSNLAPLPSLPESPAPAVLAGAFWNNGSTEVAVLGGNFTFVAPGTSSPAQSVAIYDPETGAVRALLGEQLNGVVRAVLVDGNRLFVGGEFTLPNNNVNGIAIYDLEKDEWDVSGLQPLQGGSVVVRSISKSESREGMIIVAGSFDQAGSLRCQAVCSLDVGTKQWNALGSGIQGEVASVVHALDDVMFVGGSLMLSDNTLGNVLQFAFGNATWTTVGTGSELPGPVTAVEVNNRNASSIFAAGQGESGPFLIHWDGSNWSSLESTLSADSTIASLSMVPLQNTHEEQGVIQQDRVLLVSGSLVDSAHGNISSALFDGKNIIPYIVSSSTTGSSGSVASLFRSLADFSFDQRKFLAVGVVILISIAIAAGVVFLLALIGILWTLFSRKDEKMNKYEVEEDDGDSTHHRPSSLLEHINAATRTTILGASPYQDYSEKDDDRSRSEPDPFGPDASNFARAETPSDAMGGMLAEEVSRPAHARYSFDGNGEGELPISAGDELEVLDDRDPAWWYARHVRTGREGVVPAAYLY
ncbi:hypothetical protein CC1G_07412 [Coprinopsis cinerea okayama7|uniref:SH3 domain-containing protein n=1 Tax=Coprinopsis cinerea (strain Okayama-7 / 130 / ATCC MYA-4618 / FGSC 9003) TaxID=240176 RepID=A8N6P1_COPC7|nr:hypothetical protein CC1G_07412 [Coprinopsis cinerea okayama7\|eukprot:XP_001830497.1 hypothetical protein CC1G_07412 [Coprinopsis cinerea okayama7\